MTRNLKTMGLALFAVLALAALGAQSASAVVNHEFTSDSGTGSTILTGTTEPGQKEIFTLTGNPISCEDVRYRGTAVGNAFDHATVVPVFSEAGTHCTLAGNVVTVENTGCTYTLDSDTFENTTHFAVGVEHANVSLECNHPAPDNGHIVIKAPECTVTVETTHTGAVKVNHNLPGVRYAVVANHAGTGKAAITVTSTVRTIKATTVGKLCPALGLGNPGTHSNGTYSGKVEVTCYEDKKAFNPHTEPAVSPTIEGNLVNCGLTT